MSPLMQPGQEPPDKGRKYPAEVLTADEVRALIGACSARSASGIRNRALIAPLHRSGLRVSEIVALRAAASTCASTASACSTARATKRPRAAST